MDAFRETRVVFVTELRRLLRSAKGLTLLALYALGASIGGLVFVWASRQVGEGLKVQLQGQDLPPEAAAAAKTQVLSLLYGTDKALLDYLTEIPVVVLFLFWTTLKFLPLLVLLLGFDQLSGDVGNRSLRFVVLRCRRGSVVVGKYLAQLGALGLITLIMEGALFAVAAALTPEFALGAGLAATLRFWLVSLVFIAAYMAVTSFCSSLFRVSWFSLIAGLCVYFAFWFTSLMASLSERLEFVRYVLPSTYEPLLVRPTLVQTLPGVGAYAAFAAVFLCASWLVVRRRDL